MDNTNEFSQEINNVHTIDDIITLKNKINNTLYSYVNKINELRKLIVILEEKLDVVCDHNWKRDHSCYGEHSQFNCSICGLYK